jgi:DNA-binding NtrC family response regulator
MSEHILVVDDETIIRDSLSYILNKEGYSVDKAKDGSEAKSMLMERFYDLVITDLEMPGIKGIELIDSIKAINIKTSIIIITAYASIDTAIQALRSGASEYILKPIDFDELIIKLKKLFEVKDILLENRVLRNEIQRNYDFENFVGKSDAIKKIYNMIKTVADTESTVLITGKSGTGKELVARSLHFNSKRKSKPFIPINCGAIAENLIESELFGHKKGAFTGALSNKEGLIKAADGGTLFLDEISELPLNLQVKLLRVLQEKEYTPVGSVNVFPVNVRFIASTNRDLKSLVDEGKFREDLYYRLNIIEINLPSLKERAEDIPFLADHFLNKYRKEMNKNIKGFSSEVMQILLNYNWQGEVRELENVIERAVIFSKKEFIIADDFPESFKTQTTEEVDRDKSLDSSVRDYEKRLILEALGNNDNDKKKAAAALNIGLSTLYRKMSELNIKVD